MVTARIESLIEELIHKFALSFASVRCSDICWQDHNIGYEERIVVVKIYHDPEATQVTGAHLKALERGSYGPILAVSPPTAASKTISTKSNPTYALSNEVRHQTSDTTSTTPRYATPVSVPSQYQTRVQSPFSVSYAPTTPSASYRPVPGRGTQGASYQVPLPTPPMREGPRPLEHRYPESYEEEEEEENSGRGWGHLRTIRSVAPW
jgi:hypothetical protein